MSVWPYRWTGWCSFGRNWPMLSGCGLPLGALQEQNVRGLARPPPDWRTQCGGTCGCRSILVRHSKRPKLCAASAQARAEYETCRDVRPLGSSEKHLLSFHLSRQRPAVLSQRRTGPLSTLYINRDVRPTWSLSSLTCISSLRAPACLPPTGTRHYLVALAHYAAATRSLPLLATSPTTTHSFPVFR
jgi:hypothetical protein